MHENEQEVDSRGGDGLACVQASVDVVQQVLESAGGSFLQVSIGITLMRAAHLTRMHCCRHEMHLFKVQCTMTRRQRHSCALPILQARCDEKGFLAVAAFGLRLVHDDSPARGLAAALAIVKGLQVGANGMHAA
jgi:hypothetical protein